MRQQSANGMSKVVPQLSRETRYEYWMSHARGLSNDSLLAKILSSGEIDAGAALPPDLGLGQQDFEAMLIMHFGLATPLRVPTPFNSNSVDVRFEERTDLINLLLANRAGQCESEGWLALIVASACMGGNHLWQDLGLWSRDDLSQLMLHNFPLLAQSNVHNMKWKRFLYKQLCLAEGINACRAPSCEVCVDYAKCFGPEE